MRNYFYISLIRVLFFCIFLLPLVNYKLIDKINSVFSDKILIKHLRRTIKPIFSSFLRFTCHFTRLDIKNTENIGHIALGTV